MQNKEYADKFSLILPKLYGYTLKTFYFTKKIKYLSTLSFYKQWISVTSSINTNDESIYSKLCPRQTTQQAFADTIQCVMYVYIGITYV